MNFVCSILPDCCLWTENSASFHHLSVLQLQKRREQDSKILQQKHCKWTKDEKTETDYFPVAEFVCDPHSAPWSANAL